MTPVLPSAERRGAVAMLLAAVLLATGVRLSEEPAVAAVARVVRARPVEHAAALAFWVERTLWAPEPTAELRIARARCEGRRWR